jgi:hypothetical membrane protein
MTTTETAAPITELGRRSAIACLIGQAVFILGWLVAGLVQDSAYSTARHDISDLGAVGAPHAWILLIAEGLSGACTLAFVVLGFYPALAGTRGRTLSAILIALPLGVGYLMDAFFRLDCRIADGCTSEQTTSSWHGILHAVNGVVWLLCLLVAPYLVARCLRRSTQWAPLARPSALLGAAIDVAVIVYLVLDGKSGAGYAQRVLVLLTSVWVALLARRLLQLHERQA